MINDMAETQVLQTTDTEWATVCDETARFFLRISADEFVQQYEAGAFEGDVPGLMAVLALFPELD